jgi:hypothetical protein
MPHSQPALSLHEHDQAIRVDADLDGLNRPAVEAKHEERLDLLGRYSREGHSTVVGGGGQEPPLAAEGQRFDLVFRCSLSCSPPVTRERPEGWRLTGPSYGSRILRSPLTRRAVSRNRRPRASGGHHCRRWPRTTHQLFFRLHTAVPFLLPRRREVREEPPSRSWRLGG